MMRDVRPERERERERERGRDFSSTNLIVEEAQHIFYVQYIFCTCRCLFFFLILYVCILLLDYLKNEISCQQNSTINETNTQPLFNIIITVQNNI